MKRNTFYIIFGLVVLAEVLAFWLSVELLTPLIIQVAFILGVAILYLARRKIEDVIDDERSVLITQKAAMRTLEIFWVVFFTISLGSAAWGLGAPMIPPHWRPEPPETLNLGFLGRLGVMQMALLGLMILLYVGFRMYYARQYGEWEDDEE
ncbi:MAG: DUF2178 domain-containing protein [Methanomicrobiales archaeon]|nr:DUF2178 domain-containing protein [Methanomicrobiales archaeon]